MKRMSVDHVPLDVTKQQRENLETLASGLLGEIEPNELYQGQGFDMNLYTYGRAAKTYCCTAGCATGWGPFFGIEKKTTEDWHDYSFRCFIDYRRDELAWNLVFSDYWADIDNTKEGAGLRIRYLLEHGVPDCPWKDFYNHYKDQL